MKQHLGGSVGGSRRLVTMRKRNLLLCCLAFLLASFFCCNGEVFKVDETLRENTTVLFAAAARRLQATPCELGSGR